MIGSNLPFIFTSASDGEVSGSIKRNFPITNNHIDFEISGEASLKGPFAFQHVGGFPHRHVPIGTTEQERPELYKLTFTNTQVTISKVDDDKPKSMFSRFNQGTRFAVFANIRDNDETGILGNYNRDHEIILTNSRLHNNKYVISTTGSWLENSGSQSTFITDIVDFEVPERPKTDYVITNRFTAIGGPETGVLTRDRETEEYSVYNTMNYRNMIPRMAQDIINREHAEQFGFRSGSTTQGSIHKINRNPQRFILGSEEAVRYDNGFITHQIPQSGYQYSWVANSVDDDVYDFLRRNNNMGYVSNFPLKHKEYNSNFSSQQVGSVPSGWKTNVSDMTASYISVEDTFTFLAASTGSSQSRTRTYSVPLDSVGDTIIVDNTIYKSSSTGYNLEFSFSTGSNIYGLYHAGVLSSDGTIAAFKNATETDLYIYKSSSSGWILDQAITGAVGYSNQNIPDYSFFFSGSSLIHVNTTGSTQFDVNEYLSIWNSSSVTGWTKTTSSAGTRHIARDVAPSFYNNNEVVYTTTDGYAVFYRYVSSSWQFVGEDDLNLQPFIDYPAATSTGGGFESIACNGETLFVGATRQKGIITIFHSGASGYTRNAFTDDQVSSPDLDFSDEFARHIEISGNLLAVGSARYDLLTEQQGRLNVNNDKGAVYIYQITGSSINLQRSFYSSKENPQDFMYFGNTFSFAGDKIVIESPRLADDPGFLSSRVDIITLSSSQTPVDLSLSGPIISGSSTGFVLKGEVIFANEIDQMPRVFENYSGNKFRIIETSGQIESSQSEFILELEVLQGSTDPSDLSNSTHGLTSTPSTEEFLFVQYRYPGGSWIDAGILISGVGTTSTKYQNSFQTYYSKIIENYKLSNIDIRIISNVDSQDDIMWAIKNVKKSNTASVLNSKSQLVKKDTYRSSPVRQITEDINSIFFSNQTLHCLGRYFPATNTAGTLLASGSHTADLCWTSASSDLARSTSIWIKPTSPGDGNSSTTHGRQVFSYGLQSSNTSIAEYGRSSAYALQLLDETNLQDGYKIRFSLSSVTVANQNANTHYYRVTTTNKFKYGKWINICVVYDGSEGNTSDSLQIYINGVKQETFQEKDNYTGMPAFDANRRLVFGNVADSFNGFYNFLGEMSNFVLFDKALSSQETKDIYALRNNLSDLSRLSTDQFRFEESSLYNNALAWWSFDSKDSQQYTYPNTWNAELGYVFTVHTDKINSFIIWGNSKNPEDKAYSNSVVTAPVSPGFTTSTIQAINIDKDLYDASDYITVSNEEEERYLKNMVSPYSYPSWLQIRGGETPVARKQKKDNKITISIRDQEVFPMVNSRYHPDRDNYLPTSADDTTSTNAREVEVYDEVMLTKKYYPLTITMHNSVFEQGFNSTGTNTTQATQEQIRETWDDDASLIGVYNPTPGLDTRLISIRSTGPNDLTMYSNEELNNKLEIDEYKRHNVSQIIQGMSSLARLENGILEISYKEGIYPKEVNTFTEKARNRTEFDFYAWRNIRADRELILTGSNQYGQTIVNIGNTKVFPEITVDKYDYQKSNEFFVDSRNITTRFSNTPQTDNLTVSRWPLDARKDFSSLPADLQKSYFKQGDLALMEAEVGENGEGVLQNDYNIFGLGYNGLYGTPPASAVYSRRIPQASGSTEYLAGEAKWQAADQSGRKPYENSEDTTEKLRRIWQDHSLVPEYKVSDFVEDMVLNNGSDFSRIKDKSNYFSVEGAVYNTSSQEVSVGTNFFKTYGTSDFMKYFGMTLEEIKKNSLGGAAQLTLKCNAAIKFTPYRGFYPAERTLQIGEIFSRGYMPEFSFVDDRKTATDRIQVTSPEKLLNRKIRANLQQVIKPLMAPGVLYNSIKSGMAVDYPIFGSSVDDSALDNFNSAIKGQINPMVEFHTASLSSLTLMTGSIVNDSIDSGIPRLSGSVSRRVTFEDLLEPQRLVGIKVYDNEPHPSASIYYGDTAITKVFDYPFQFGSLDPDNNQSKVFASNFSLNKTLDDTLTPYKMAINNFCAETVNFFIEGSELASLESDQVNANFVSGTAYKMRVHVKNNSLTMYDRHSAFGPPVDEGNLTFTEITGSLITTPGQGSSAELGQASITIAASSIGTTNFTLTDSNADTIIVHIIDGSSGSDITTGIFGPGSGTPYDVSQYGNVYANSNTSSIDLGSIEDSGQDTATALNKLLEVAINHQRWQGNIDIEAATVNGIIRLMQLTTGSIGDTPISTAGNIDSLYPNFPASFSGGTTSSIDSTGVSTSQVTVSSSHEYAPFVPPYLDSGADPYVEITFSPSETRSYSLEEILQSSTYDYVNFKDTPSNASSNTNHKEAMSISASLDLQNFVAYKEGNIDTGTTLEQRKRWIIQTKWETPILNFKNVSVDALNLSSSVVETVSGSPWQTRTWNQYLTKSALTQTSQYLTASTGMWHQYGSLLNSNEGYTISIKPVEGVSKEAQLARKVGFLGEDMKPVFATPGRIAQKKEVSEAVVAIPFYIDQNNDKLKFFTVKNTHVSNALTLNQEKEMEYHEAVHGMSKLSEQYKATREEYLEFFNNPGASAREAVAYQMRMMKKFVFPPQFDYYTYPDLSQKPMMYVFQFNAEFTKQDLANIWQNLSPESVKSGADPRGSSVFNPEILGIRQDVQYVTNFLTKKELPWSQRKAFFDNDVRWLIFKVKQRAEKDLANVKIASFPGSKNNLAIDQARTSVKHSDYLQDKAYSYNWPYDYFSLVELIKVEGKVDFLPFGDDGST